MNATNAAAITFIGVIFLATLNMLWSIPAAKRMRPDLPLDLLIYIYAVLTVVCAGVGAAIVHATWGAP